MKLSVSSLESILKEKKKCLEKMLVLTESQRDAVEGEEIELLEKMIDEKGETIDCIDKLDCEFKSLTVGFDIKDEMLLSLLGDIKETLKKIKVVDDEVNIKLSLTVADMKSDLKDIREGKRAIKTYGNSDPYQSFASQGGTLFIDQDT